MGIDDNGEGVRPRRGSRRRRANVEGGRSVARKLTLSAHEELVLRLRADELGWSVQRLLVESAMADRGESATQRQEALATLFQAARFLGAVSNNVNQIARAVNATAEVHEDLAATLAATRRAIARVDEALLVLGANR